MSHTNRLHDPDYGDYLYDRKKDKELDEALTAFDAGYDAAKKGKHLTDINVSDLWAWHDVDFYRGFRAGLQDEEKEVDPFQDALDQSRDYPTERFAHDALTSLHDFIDICVKRKDFFTVDEAKKLQSVIQILEARENG